MAHFHRYPDGGALTGADAIEIVRALAQASQRAARGRGVDELRMSRVRDYELRYPDQEAMRAHRSYRDSVAFDCAIEQLTAHMERDPTEPRVVIISGGNEP